MKMCSSCMKLITNLELQVKFASEIGLDGVWFNKRASLCSGNQ